jgi:hypothetical protein
MRQESPLSPWGCLDSFPSGLNTGKKFFWTLIERKVVPVSGEFFDLNPGAITGCRLVVHMWQRSLLSPPTTNVALSRAGLEEAMVEKKA